MWTRIRARTKDQGQQTKEQVAKWRIAALPAVSVSFSPGNEERKKKSSPYLIIVAVIAHDCSVLAAEFQQHGSQRVCRIAHHHFANTRRTDKHNLIGRQVGRYCSAKVEQHIHTRTQHETHKTIYIYLYKIYICICSKKNQTNKQNKQILHNKLNHETPFLRQTLSRQSRSGQSQSRPAQGQESDPAPSMLRG